LAFALLIKIFMPALSISEPGKNGAIKGYRFIHFVGSGVMFAGIR
jgi:hypothetical protein